MTRLPARLIARLAKARIARVFKPSTGHSPVHFIDAAEILHPGSAAPVSYEKMQRILQSPAPLIWIGGSEPLLHPGIAHFVRAVAQSDHCVFLETSGTLLRRRIHEFQPLPQIFFVVRLDPHQGSDFDFAVEGLRAARLSGFFTAIHSVIREKSDLPELARLRAFLNELDVDGWLITGESGDAGASGNTLEARSLVPSAFWRWFSPQVERELSSLSSSKEAFSASENNPPHEQMTEEEVKAV